MCKLNVKFTPIILKFKGTDTINEVYQLHFKEFKQTLEALTTSKQLEAARLEIIELQAIIENKQAKLLGY